MKSNHPIITTALALICAGSSFSATAQSAFPSQQAEIMRNNLTLHAQHGVCEAAHAENMSGLNLPNPEVSFGYMWGQPSDVPHKINVEASQTFDFATLSGAKKRVARANNAVAEAEYAGSRQALALSVENALINYLYQCQLCIELTNQLSQLKGLMEYAVKAIDKGSITQLDYNNIELEMLAKESELSQAGQGLETARLQLRAMNGGKELSPLPTAWPEAALPLSFDQWLASAQSTNAELQALQAGVALTAEEITLRKRENLPEFTVGYANELIKGDNHHGITLGVSVPLWGNSGRVKAAKAREAAARINLMTAAEQYAVTKRTEYEQAQILAKTADRYASLYKHIQDKNKAVLKKAFDSGTINVFEFITEQNNFFDYSLKHIEAIREYQLARAALYAPTF